MVRQVGFVALALAASVFAGGAQAATFSIASETGSGHVTQTLGNNFNPTGFSNTDGVGVGTTITVFTADNDGWVGNNHTTSTGLFLTSTGSTTVTITYMGHEASNTDVTEDRSTYNSTSVFNNQSTSVGTQVTETLGSGTNLIPFLFADQTANPDAVAPNGGPFGDDVSLGAWVSANGQVAYLFFDDANANSDGHDGSQDSDFDDLVVRLTLTPTPLPATLPLFAGGLGMVGFLTRRKKRAQTAAA
jgi:hypothetical protein